MRYERHGLERVLRWINEVRAAVDAPPLTEIPAGERRKADRCPIARAIPVEGVSVAQDNILFPYESGVQANRIRSRMRLRRITMFGYSLNIYLRVPRYISDFIKAFDLGAYPELNVRTSEGRATLRRQREKGIQPPRRG